MDSELEIKLEFVTFYFLESKPALWVNLANLSHELSLFTAGILMSHSRKDTGGINKINDGSAQEMIAVRLLY